MIEVLRGIRNGRPELGPQTVHIDVTNTCNARCVTCWDHSPLRTVPRSQAWKRRSMAPEAFSDLMDQLDALGSVSQVILSGMGEPLTHPHIYAMMAAVKRRGLRLTVLSNLVAADPDRLCDAGIDQLLVGVHGVTPDTYVAFHPGWTEDTFFAMCGLLRRLAMTDTRVRHVQVIDRNTAPEVVQMVRFGRRFGADRVNFKLASLAEGTEATALRPEQRSWLLAEGLEAAQELAVRLGVATNLDLFARQVRAGTDADTTTVPIDRIGCFMGYAYTRITVDRTVLYCCNTAVEVGSLRDTSLAVLWTGPRWQELRERLRAGRYLEGCDRCGKLEQNAKWSERYRAWAGDDAWAEATGQHAAVP